MQITDQKLNKVIKILIIISLVLVCTYIIGQFSGFINNLLAAIKAVATPFLIAFFINFLIYPLVIYAEEKGVRPRWLIVTLIYIFVFGIIAVVMWQVTPIVIEQIKDLVVNKIPEIYENFNKSIEALNLKDNPTLSNIYDQIQVGIQKYLTEAVVSASTSISNIFSFIFTIVLSPIILFYMLKDHNEISEGLYNIVPVKYKIHFAELVKRANETLGLYIRGQIILMVGIAVISTLGYTLIGLDNAILFGIIVGLTNIIPYIGATLAAVVPVTYSLLTGDVPWYYIILLNIGFQFIEGNILQPIIMSKQLDIHPLIILVAILGFGSLFGVLGIIFAVPLAGLIKVCILYINEIREKNELVEDEL